VAGELFGEGFKGVGQELVVVGKLQKLGMNKFDEVGDVPNPFRVEKEHALEAEHGEVFLGVGKRKAAKFLQYLLRKTLPLPKHKFGHRQRVEKAACGKLGLGAGEEDHPELLFLGLGEGAKKRRGELFL